MTPADCKKLFDHAHDAAMHAAMNMTPRPMVVGIPGQHVDVIDDGVCGFAWVVLRPATTPFARWMKDNKGCRKHYYGGLEYNICDFNQSYERKLAYARRFAEFVSAFGITASADGRLD
jgi:hypothetical protein